MKNINANNEAGFHIMYLNSFDLFYVAEQNYRKLGQLADMLKICLYNNCVGPRMAYYIDGVHSTIWHDSPAQSVLDLYYNILGYKGEAPLDKLATVGFSSDYVYRKTKRALADITRTWITAPAPNTDLAEPVHEQDILELSRQLAICPGIDIDTPTGKRQKRTQPSDVRAAVKAAFDAGPPGVILSRKYSEMRLDNLSSAGATLNDLGIRT